MANFDEGTLWFNAIYIIPKEVEKRITRYIIHKDSDNTSGHWKEYCSNGSLITLYF